jgi:hypothetical protein
MVVFILRGRKKLSLSFFKKGHLTLGHYINNWVFLDIDKKTEEQNQMLFIDATKQHALENDVSSIVGAVAGYRFPCPSPRFEIILVLREHSVPLSCFSCVENGRRQPWELPHDVTAITTFFFFPFSSGFSACAGAWSDFATV